MEDTLGLKDDPKNASTQEWPLDHEGDLSKQILNTTLKQQPLQVIGKNKIFSARPVIPATFMEKLSFFRAYTSTMSKIEIFCEQQNSVKRFIWFYVFNALCKTFPMTYVYLFLGIYSPDHHLFLPKMVPLLYGYNFIFLITGFFGLILMARNIVIYIAYFIFGIIDTIPWNRCIENYTGEDFNYSCLNLHEFTQKIIGSDITYEEGFYKKGSSDYFTLAQIEYYEKFPDTYEKSFEFNRNGTLMFILLSLWLIAAYLRSHIFKRYIWKILHRSQLLLCGVYALSFFHLLITYEDRPINYIKHDLRYVDELMVADFDLLAESLTAPPIAHIIASRSEGEVKPSLNSALISLSNSLFYIFRATTSYLCKKYGENWVNASIIYWHYGSGSIFYSWPIYFSTIYGGDFFVLIFFALNAVVEYCTFLITFQCLIQTFLSEWERIKPWCVAIILLSAALADYFTSEMFSETSYILWTCLSTLSETIVIFWIYPMGRFIDDITFYYGVPPTKFRVWSFVFLPYFYTLKAIIIYEVIILYDYENSVQIILCTFVLQFFLLIFGAVSTFYCYKHKKKRNFSHLFKPVPEWGPKNFKLRQLRKKFDSREYIRSLAPRVLSSHLIGKSEKSSYKLDIPYESRGASPISFGAS